MRRIRSLSVVPALALAIAIAACSPSGPDGNAAAANESAANAQGQAKRYLSQPLVTSIYTADPAPIVVGDRIYLLADHDENGSTTYNMKDWRLFSTAVSG